MMNIIGMWEVSAIMSYDNDQFVWLTQEEAQNKEDYDSRMFSSVTEFMPDGTVRNMMKIPPEMTQAEIDEAVSEGMELVGDFIVTEKREWKEENGTLFYNSNIQGTVFDEDIDPWTEIVVEDNGEITIMEMMKMKRA